MKRVAKMILRPAELTRSERIVWRMPGPRISQPPFEDGASEESILIIHLRSLRFRRSSRLSIQARTLERR